LYHFTQKFWRGWSKNWGGGGLEPLSPIAGAATAWTGETPVAVGQTDRQDGR